MSESGHCFSGFPGSLRIGAYDWQVKLPPEIKDAETGDDLAGECDERGFAFNFNTSAEIHPFPLAALETVIHEISHSVFSITHLTKGDTEERVCLSMGSVWTQVLRDNPKLVSWMVTALASVEKADNDACERADHSGLEGNATVASQDR